MLATNLNSCTLSLGVIKYRKFADDTRPEGVSYYPLLQVFLRHDVNIKKTLALVDSGSVDCVFPASIGELLNVDIRSGEPYAFHGFDLRLVPGFVHKVHCKWQGLRIGLQSMPCS